MVGPGEVDEDLEPETAEECSKYGEVDKCVIFEVITCMAIIIRMVKDGMVMVDISPFLPREK